MENNVQFQHISGIEPLCQDFTRFGDDYIYARLAPGRKWPRGLVNPSRYEGLMFILCREGEIDLEINMQRVHLSSRSLLLASSQTVVKLSSESPMTNDAYLLMLSPEFMRNVAIDLNTLSISPFAPENRRHELTLTPTEFDMMAGIFELFYKNNECNTNPVYVKAIARTLAATIFYQIMQLGTDRLEENTANRNISRRMNYVSEFMSLVHMHYRKHRNVGYYAGKLFISPKYLSLIIKESTGRSAAEWIDECVIMEAKNLLRFSGKNVQQIAYELNFNNQSSFGKYFKNLTGLSPTQFQQS